MSHRSMSCHTIYSGCSLNDFPCAATTVAANDSGQYTHFLYRFATAGRSQLLLVHIHLYGMRTPIWAAGELSNLIALHFARNLE